VQHVAGAVLAFKEMRFEGVSFLFAHFAELIAFGGVCRESLFVVHGPPHSYSAVGGAAVSPVARRSTGSTVPSSVEACRNRALARCRSTRRYSRSTPSVRQMSSLG